MTQLVTDDFYYYDEQLRQYILQFMAIFAGFKVRVGKRDDRDPTLIPVHLTFGPKDRVVAAIKAGNTQNKPLRLPAMSANLSGLALAPQLRKGVGVHRRETLFQTGGQFPDDIKTVEQLMPIPFMAQMELSIYTSNRQEHHQLIEQILLFFDPQLQIQKNDDLLDWTRITTVELVGINFEENYPSGTDRRIIQTTLQFEMPVYLAVPKKIKNNYIADIQLRIGLVTGSSTNSGDIIAELDDLGFEYDTIFNLDDFELPE